MSDRTGAVHQYSKDGILRKVMDDLQFPNGIAVSPDNGTLAVGDCTAGRMLYAAFATGPTMGTPGATPDPLHLTFQGVKAGTYFPGNGCPDGLHYDVKGNLWAAAARLGGILQIGPRGIIVGFVPVPNGDLATTNFAFGGSGNRGIFLKGAISGTFWRSKRRFPA
jgi:gluconolactonase